MKEYKVAVTSSDEYPVRTDCLNDIFENFATVDDIKMPFKKLDWKETDTFTEILMPYDAILVRSGIFDENLLNKLNNLKIICVHGAGYDQINIESANKYGIYVSNVPGANAISVIELTIGLMLTTVRKLYDSIFTLSYKHDWNTAKINGSELYAKKLGVIGFGKIGQGVAQRALSFGMEIKAFDPYVKKQLFINNHEKLSICDDINDLFVESDILTLHLPLNDETKGIINKKNMSKMKSNCILINTSRGPLINEKDLFEALVNKKIGGAALDVFSTEPINSQSKLFDLDNVILTPHIGGSTNEALERIAKLAGENIYSFLQTGQVNNLVNSPKATK